MNTITKEQFIALVQNNKYFDIEEVTEKRDELNEVIEKINKYVENGVTDTFNFKMYELSSLIYDMELSDDEGIKLFNDITYFEWNEFENVTMNNLFPLLEFGEVGRTSTRFLVPKNTLEDQHEMIFTESEKYNLDEEVHWEYNTWEKSIYEIAIGITEIEDFEDIENRMEYDLSSYDEIEIDDYHSIIADWKDDLIVKLDEEFYLLKEVLEVLKQAREFHEYLEAFQSEENAKDLIERYYEKELYIESV